MTENLDPENAAELM